MASVEINLDAPVEEKNGTTVNIEGTEDLKAGIDVSFSTGSGNKVGTPIVLEDPVDPKEV